MYHHWQKTKKKPDGSVRNLNDDKGAKREERDRERKCRSSTKNCREGGGC